MCVMTLHDEHTFAWPEAMRILAVALAAAAVWWRVWEPIGSLSVIGQAGITGESMPVEKTAGATVYAGSLNQSGVLEIRTERIGRDTSYGKIIEAVEQAERSRAPVQRLADQLAGYLVYFALGAALLT